MSVNPNSVRQIVQAVNEKIDASHGVLNQEIGAVIKVALDKLSQMPIMNGKDSVDLVALTSRITTLSQNRQEALPESLFERVHGRGDISSGQNLISTDFEECIVKAKCLRKKGVEWFRDELEEVPLEKQDAIIQAVARFIKEDTEVFEIGSILRDAAVIPEEELAGVIQIAAPFIKKDMDICYIGSFLKAVAEIPKEERANVFLAAADFIKEDMNAQEITAILKAVALIPFEKRERIFQKVEPLVKQGMNGETVASILRLLSQVSDRDRSELCEILAPLMEESVNDYHMGFLLNTLLRIPHIEKSVFCLAARPFIKEREESFYVREILGTAATIPRSERVDFCLAIGHLLKKGCFFEAREKSFNRVIKIPPQERIGFCLSLKSVLKEEMNSRDVLALLDAIKDIPAEARESSCRVANLLIKENMTYRDMSDILKVVAAISPEERELVVSQSQLLFTEKMSASEKVFLLTRVSKIPARELMGLCSAALGFIKQSTSGYDIAYILNSVAGIPEEKREAVFRASSQFIKESTSRYDIAAILTAVGGIPEENRALVCSAAALFSRNDLSGNEIALRINGLQKIPTQNKDVLFQCLKKTEEYGNKAMVNFLREFLFANRDSIEYGESLGSLTESGGVVHKILPFIVLARWIADIKKENPSFTEEDRMSADKEISGLIGFLGKSKRAFKDVASRLMQPYLLATKALDSSRLTSVRKIQLLSNICQQEERIKGFALICALCGRTEFEALETLSLDDSIKSLTEALEESLERDQFIDLSGIENLGDKYLSTFDNTRIPFAVETYMAGIRTLNEGSVNKTLERLIRSVLLETFDAERYDVSKSPHLKKIQDYDVEMGKTVLEDWKRLTFKAEALSEAIPAQEKKFSFEGFFKEKLGDGHSIKDEEDMLPELSSFFKEALEKRADFLGNHKRTVLGMQALIKTETDSEKRKTIALALKLAQAELSCMELVLNVGLSKEEQTKKMQAVSASLSSLDLEIAADLGGLARMFKEPEVSHSLETVELCKGWEDLFLAGSEVEGSCQRINGNPDLNKCLLAYCLDGKNAMVAVKDPGGKLLARSMLRLLWDAAENKPVLFLDRLYPSPCSRERESSIQMASIACARTLGVELFTKGTVSSWTGKTIESLGSSCPFEYADASDGVMTKGVFTIRNPQKIKTSI